MSAGAVRRYLEVRWGELLGPRPAGRPAKTTERKSSVTADDSLSRDQRHEFRKLAADKERVVEQIRAEPRWIAKSEWPANVNDVNETRLAAADHVAA
jgi:hypothetical protein